MDYQVQTKPNRNNLAMAALVLAVLALLTSITGILPLIFGSLAIILAILSKGSKEPYASPAVISFVLSAVSMIVGLIASVFILTMSFRMVGDMMKSPELRQEFYDMYGDIYEELYGIDIESQMEQLIESTQE